ncbi:hypothetical protein [Synechocystis salina]|uniref:hypothetical protein n=1 Tax=Synechocystis salina TaxID=945780 RepID=UPI001D147CEA|nr:hypothetical protein [Synechocystis salina]
MPPIVSPPPPPVPIEVISPRETEEVLATDGATLSSSTPPSADPAIAQASAKDLYLNPNSGLSLGGAPVAPNSKIGDRPVEVPIPTAKKIISQSRDGEVQEYLITAPSESELEVITGATREAEPTVEEKDQEAIGEVLEIDPGAPQQKQKITKSRANFLIAPLFRPRRRMKSPFPRK